MTSGLRAPARQAGLGCSRFLLRRPLPGSDGRLTGRVYHGFARPTRLASNEPGQPEKRRPSQSSILDTPRAYEQALHSKRCEYVPSVRGQQATTLFHPGSVAASEVGGRSVASWPPTRSTAP